MTLNRAVAQVALLKSVNDDQRIVEGIASTPTPDRYEDIAYSSGAKFVLPIPLLWQHDHERPVGKLVFAAADARAVGFKAQFAKCDEPGLLRDRLEDAWHSIKAGLVRGISIGFRPLKMEPRRDGPGIRLSGEWLELSCVTLGAKADATITAIRSADAAQLRLLAPPVRIVRLDGGTAAHDDVVRLTPADWRAKAS